MPKHTPGPWTFKEGQVYSENDTSGKTIALIRTDEQDCRLIAAAPDMLDALKECITSEGAYCFGKDSKAGYKIRIRAITEIAEKAIRKATE